MKENLSMCFGRPQAQRRYAVQVLGAPLLLHLRREALVLPKLGSHEGHTVEKVKSWRLHHWSLVVKHWWNMSNSWVIIKYGLSVVKSMVIKYVILNFSRWSLVPTGYNKSWCYEFSLVINGFSAWMNGWHVDKATNNKPALWIDGWIGYIIVILGMVNLMLY